MPLIIEFVWAIAQNPPKDVNANTEGNIVASGMSKPETKEIPQEISNVGRNHVSGNFSQSLNKMENKIIYPPILVIVSNPFIIQLSKI